MNNKALRLLISEETTKLVVKIEEISNNLLNTEQVKKLIVAYGLKNYKARTKTKSDNKNKESRGDFYSSNIFDALISQREKDGNLDYLYKKHYYEDCIFIGTELIVQKLNECKDDKRFILDLIISEILKEGYKTGKGIRKIVDPNILNINIKLGADIQGDDIDINFNDSLNSGYHMGIVGTTGSGKSQLALNFTSQIINKSSKTNIIVFDYAKGDIANNNKYVSDINAQVIDVLNEGVPFNPFNINNITDMKIEELKELIVSTQHMIGPNQKMELYDVMKMAFKENEEVDFNILNREVKDYYKSNNKEYNVLVELFHKISILDIFKNESQSSLIDSFMESNIIFDLHNIESTMSIKELVVFFILNKLYTEAIKLPDSKIDEESGCREIRTIILLDEGHNYLKTKNPILEKMFRELRSKGVAIIVVTQAFSDFKTKNFDYSEMMNWVMVMKSQIDSRSIQQALNVDSEQSKELQVKIPNLPAFSYYARGIKDKDNNITLIKNEKYNK